MKITFLIVFSVVALNLQAQWTKTNYPTDKSITSVVTVGSYLYAGTNQNYIYRSSNEGNSWTVISNGLTTNHINELISRSSGSITALFAATDSGIFRSSNNGSLWISINNGIVDKNIGTVYKTDNYMFAGAETKTYRSTNNGSTWAEITIGSSNQKTNAFTRQTNTIFAGLQNTGNYVYKSTDFGVTWTPSGNGIPGNTLDIEKHGNRLFACTYATLSVSTNGGNNWAATVTGIPSGYPITELKSFGDYLFISAFSGIYILHTDSSQVRNISGNITFPHIISVDIDNDIILVGVFNITNTTYEVWRRPTSTITNAISGNEWKLPKKYSLEQNYPNPFNPETNIKFDIPGGSNSYNQNIVKLSVFDLLGKEVAVLVNSKLQPGTYEYTFNGSKLSSGIYFYTLKTQSVSYTKKMLMIK